MCLKIRRNVKVLCALVAFLTCFSLSGYYGLKSENGGVFNARDKFLCIFKNCGSVSANNTQINRVHIYGRTALHIIVITYDRHASLTRLLQSLNKASYYGDSVVLDVWVDRSKTGKIHELTVSAAKKFVFEHGTYTVNVHDKHAGIIGQWLYTWQPKNNSKKIAVILEDDLTVSPLFYQYLKLVHSKYDKNDHINGFSLHGHTIRHSDGAIMQDIPFKHNVFLYPTIGSWGFSPSNPKWFKFVDWFKNALKDKSFNPLVPGNIASVWYQSFRQQGKEDSMWTIWHIYYAWKHNELTLYPNFPGHKGFTFNWKENGLHFKGSSIKEPNADFDGLVQTLNLRYELLPDEPIVVRNDGTTQ